MQLIDGVLVHSASDLNAFTECLHLTALKRAVALGEAKKPNVENPTGDLLARKGDDHERRYAERMQYEYGADFVAFTERPAATRAAYLAAEAATLDAMARGAKIIFQATFFDGTFLGRADFLRRVEKPSERFAWSYEVIDTKLALSTKPYFLIQLCQYSEHLARLQGTLPTHASIVLGNGYEQRFEIDEYISYYRRLKSDYLESVAREADAYPFEVPHCDLCPWRVACATRRDRDDHLSLVARMRHDQVAKFEAAGIATLAELAAAPDDRRPKKMATETFATLRSQAWEQNRYRVARRIDADAKHSYTFRTPEDPRDGFGRLPKPDDGDVFFDMEGDPLYLPGRPLEYLFGVYLAAAGTYRAFWGTSPPEERLAFEAFMDFVAERRKTYPNLHVYHYAPYETTALKRLAGTYASREELLDEFLRAKLFVDLYPVVRQSVFISQPSYSIKKVEALYGFTRETTTKGGDDSIVQFEAWLESKDDEILEDIERYNDDDCRSTYLLRDWLVDLRAERNERLAAPIAWRSDFYEQAGVVDAAQSQAPIDAKTEERNREKAAAAAAQAALKERLIGTAKPPLTLLDMRRFDDDARARWLLGNLLGFHRREQLPQWWEHFHRIENNDELEELDRRSIGGLVHRLEIEPYKASPGDRNHVHAFSFPPQENGFDPGDEVLDATTGKKAGDVISIDVTGDLRLKVSGKIDPGSFRALIPRKPLDIENKVHAVTRIATAYLDGSLERDHPATLSLLLGRVPRLRGTAHGASIQPDVVSASSVTAIVESLDASHLMVQGPPGSGKSTIAASVVLSLLADHKRVALASTSHKALHSLCRKIEKTAHKANFTFAGCHKSSKRNVGSAYESYDVHPMIADTLDRNAFGSCSLVSATTYEWADPAAPGDFDTIFIDEAGQVSIADALITSLAARNVVLIGDPQQLPQVVSGSHPVGTALSVLEHLLGTAPTIQKDRGIFLDTSYRMQPDVDRFISNAFYDGRLNANPENLGNRVSGTALADRGPIFADVEHDGNERRSVEEAELVAASVDELLASGSVVIGEEAERRVVPDDILVVAPYNVQRIAIDGELAARGISGIRVGTVDKFQGQEAPIVFFSMATSSAELAPRGVDFLLSPNRLNVAVSRSQALSVLVCSPRLLSSHAKSIEQIRLLSLLCRYVEIARPLESVAMVNA